MNYIVLNGKNSTFVHGLMILELPPITKAKKRTQVTEIDGVDGDRVTTLGYAAYNKKIRIGLHGNYDVDDVLAYFNSSGIVTFSNEPDKYYRYEVIEQIDLEKLIRFKKATVTFHVQPFKYSNVEQLKDKDFNYLSMLYHTEEKQGLILESNEKTFTIKGTATGETEFYIPIDPITLNPDNYTLSATADGTNPEQAKIRLIHNTPINSNTFGGYQKTLQNGTVSIMQAVNDEKSYNYLWLKIAANATVDFTASIELTGTNKEVTVMNVGNIESKPTLTIYGSGTIYVSLNDVSVFRIDLGNEEYIIIDTEAFEAYKGDYLKNRLVTGDYDAFSLRVGNNKISFYGNVTKFDIVNYSRWC